MNAWRKLAVSSWKQDTTGTIYAKVDVNAENLLRFLEKYNNENQARVTVTHFVAKALGKLLNEYPLLNSIIMGGKIFERETCDVFVAASLKNEGDENLSGVLIRDINQKSIEEVSDHIYSSAKQIRRGNDVSLKVVKNIIHCVPSFMVGGLLRLSGFLQYRLNVWAPILGNQQDAFGSIILTNVGTFGIKEAFVPMVNNSGVHTMCALGKIQDNVKVIEGKVVPTKTFSLCWTIDHRLVDGSTAGQMQKALDKYFENPSLVLT